MLPSRRKKIIIIAVSIIALVLIVIGMYYFSSFMRNINNDEEPIIYDDSYLNDYLYYGFYLDANNNYQLVGLNESYEEKELGLRTFYKMNNLYYYNNHLVLYSDAINQINYNSSNDTYSFYELNSFYSSNTDVLITPNYYVFVTATSLDYCVIDNCVRSTITNELVNSEVVVNDHYVFYQTNMGIYMFNLETSETEEVLAYEDELHIIMTRDDYLVMQRKDAYWVYKISNRELRNISEAIINNGDTTYDFVNLQNEYFLYQTVVDNHYVLKKYSLRINDILQNYYTLAGRIEKSIVINDSLLYTEVAEGENSLPLLIDIDDGSILQNLNYQYEVLIGVE